MGNSSAMIGILLAAQLSATSIMQEAMRSQGEDPAGVEIIEVEKDHPLLRQGARQRVAVAVRNTDGEEFILVQIDPPEEIEPLIQHETAHLIAWREHGEKITEHGYEFLKACRAVVTTRKAYYCRGGS